MRAAPSGHSLSYRDTQIVKGMLRRGDRQHDIASYFGVNPGRIAEIAAGTNNYPNAEPADVDQLPPPGPYLTRFAAGTVIATMNSAIEALKLAEAETSMQNMKAAIELAKETIQSKINSITEA